MPTRQVTQYRHKVIAYITHGDRLLVFRQPAAPAAGVQVPAGTIEKEESPDLAVVREAIEETGIERFDSVHKLGCYEWHWSETVIHERHVYHLTVSGDLPETWTHFERHSGRTDEPLAFDFFWLPLFGSTIGLMNGQGDLLALLRARLQSQ
jgi:8-oxo-dGTP pyrophosphatase MutT (NUDIX family)